MLNPIYLAMDIPDAAMAQQIIGEVRDYIGGVKLGLSFLYANGPAVIADTVAGFDWFFDAKLHDIPYQVAGAIRAIMPLKPTYITVHIGELKPNASERDRRSEELMLRAAVDAAGEASTKLGVACPHLLGVTTLTHLPATPTEILAKAHRALSCGLDGVVCSPLELRMLRDELGTTPILLTPGIRSNDAPVTDDDQLRTATPREAMAAGANILVVGRPITQAPDRRQAARSLLGSLQDRMIRTTQEFEILSDGRSVWVNSPGGCIGRFGPQGIDVHRSVEEQMEGQPACLACSKGPTNVHDWRRFQEWMLRRYSVTVSDCHMPTTLTSLR